MGGAGAASAADHAEIVDVVPVIRRVVAARVPDRHTVDDIVQETVTRVMSVSERLEEGAITPYAIVTARNLVSTWWERADVARRNAHRVVDLDEPTRPDDVLVQDEEAKAVTDALGRLAEPDRDAIIAHEINGQDTASLAHERGSTPGAVAAQLNRARARLRVEYLIALERLVDLPTERCRPVLLALSGGDRRRQREVDAGRHLLECRTCAALSVPLLERRREDSDDVRVVVGRDADIVAARHKAREVAEEAGFTPTDRTLIATAVSEIARNIVRFAGHGEITVRRVQDSGREGIQVVARDTGPGIPDVETALKDGYSTYGGMGLGLPGCRRIMDDFAIASAVDEGTTVTMTKWAVTGTSAQTVPIEPANRGKARRA
ncbi:MAG: sigma-70 family RNA polymerase sigma factor [Frankiaceae bacterium]